MDNSELRSNWPEIKKKLQQKYPQLTAEDLRYEIGKEADLLETLQARLKKNWKEIKEVLALLG